MTRTSKLVVIALPSLPGEVSARFEESAYSASYAEYEDGFLSFTVGPTWFTSPIVPRRVLIGPLRARLRTGFQVAGFIEKDGVRWKIQVEVSKPPK